MNRFVKVAVSCAECGKVRGEANHWFVLTDVRHSQALPTTDLYWVNQLDPDNLPKATVMYPVCGEQCLSALEGKILSGKKL